MRLAQRLKMAGFSGGTTPPPQSEEMTVAWVPTDQHGIIAYDIRDPSNITEIARSQIGDFDSVESFQKIDVDATNDIGFVGHAGDCPCKIYTINTSDPLVSSTWNAGSVDVDVSGWCKTGLTYDEINNILYTGSGLNSDPNNLIGIFDVSSTSAPIQLATVDDRECFPIIDKINNVFYTPSTGYGTDLESYDMSDPVNPVLLGTLTEGGGYKTAYGAFDYERDYLFIVTTGDSIRIIDISDPSNMVLINEFNGYDTGNGIAYDSNEKMILVSHGGAGEFSIGCYDVTDPLNPIIYGGMESGVMANMKIDTERKIAFFTGGANGSLYAMSYPDMTELSYLTTPTDPRGLALTKATLPPKGQILLETNSNWAVPEGVTSVSVICIGAGGRGGSQADIYSGAGGGGGALVYLNNLPVTEGQEFDVTVNTIESSFSLDASNKITAGVGGNAPTPPIGGARGEYSLTGFSEAELAFGSEGGLGGAANSAGAGGGGAAAGNYETSGGADGGSENAGENGISGGGGGGGGQDDSRYSGGGGGGINPYGMGESGQGGSSNAGGGGGGSGGSSGGSGSSTNPGGRGGTYGGGGGGGAYEAYADEGYEPMNQSPGSGGKGCVRIIWPGDERYFPDTRTEDE